MERELSRLLAEHKRGNGQLSRELIKVAIRSGGRGLPINMAASVKWIMAWADNKLPELTPEEYTSSDPDFIPNLMYSERVWLFYPNGTLAAKFVTRTGQMETVYEASYDDSPRVRHVGYIGRRVSHGDDIELAHKMDFPPLMNNCLEIDMVSFLDAVKDSELFDSAFRRKHDPRRYYTPFFHRFKTEYYTDNSGDHRCFGDGEVKRSKKTIKKRRKRGDTGPRDNYKSFRYARTYPNDSSAGLYIAKSDIHIVDALSHPMYRGLNNQQRNMLLSWAKAQ